MALAGNGMDLKMTEADPGSDRRWSIPAALFLLGLLLRLLNWNRSGLWLDECITAYRVADLHTVFHLNDGSPWFYPLVVWLSTSIMGLSETSLRLPSLLAGAALGPAIYVIVRQRFSTPTALFPSLLAIFNQFSLHYSQEARVYALATLLAVVWSGTLFNLIYPSSEHPPSPRLKICFILISPMFALCHHYCLFVGAGGALTAAIHLRNNPELRARVLSSILAAYALTIAIWLPSMLIFTIDTAKQVSTAQTNPFAAPVPADAAIDAACGTVLNGYLGGQFLGLAATVVLASALVLALGTSPQRPDWFWGILYLFSLCFLILANWWVPNFVGRRYEAPFLGLAIVAIGLVLPKISCRSTRYAIAILLLLSQLGLCLSLWSFPLPKSASREMATFIADAKPDLVMSTLLNGYDAILLMPMTFYLHETRKLPIPIVEIPRFVQVPDGYIPPTAYYLLYDELHAIPQEEANRKLRDTLRRYKKVALLGQEPEMDRLTSVLKDFTISKHAYFRGYNEGGGVTTMVLIIEPPMAER